jgi:hypothetical protein
VDSHEKTLKRKTILEQGQDLAKDLTTSVEDGKSGSVGIEVKDRKLKIGVAQKFTGKKVSGEIGAEVELEQDQKPNVKVGGKISWD